MLYFVEIDNNKEISTKLCSMFENDLLKNTKCMKHWSGRNTKGVTQFYGHIIRELLAKSETVINIAYSIERLKEMIAL